MPCPALIGGEGDEAGGGQLGVERNDVPGARGLEPPAVRIGPHQDHVGIIPPGHVLDPQGTRLVETEAGKQGQQRHPKAGVTLAGAVAGRRPEDRPKLIDRERQAGLPGIRLRRRHRQADLRHERAESGGFAR
jgi:hypothetical protein